MYADRSTPDVYGTSSAPFSSFLAGTSTWTFVNNICYRDDELVNLTFTTCGFNGGQGKSLK